MDKYSKMKDRVKSIMSETRRGRMKPKEDEAVVTIRKMKSDPGGFEPDGDELDPEILDVLKNLKR